ncbi:MAG: sarcosine oxidase subunit gamma family protein [Pseudomonadota bacterium]
MAEAQHFEGIARIEQGPTVGMIALRGGPETLQSAAARLGVAMPDPLQAVWSGPTGLLWMSPDECLALCPPEDLDGHVAALTATLAGQHAMVLDVSDMRARFAVSGPHARDVLAKVFPLDLSEQGFGPGHVRRSKLGQVPAALWLNTAGVFEILCFRSVAVYVMDVLTTAAQPGSEVHLFAPSS